MKNRKFSSPVPPVSAEILGTREILVSGCTGIIHFSDDNIGVRTSGPSVWVSGDGLSLCWAGDGKLMIKGVIRAVEYKGEK